MCVDDEEWVFIMQLASTLPHSIGNIASWMMFKLTNLLTVFIIHTSSIKGRDPVLVVLVATTKIVTDFAKSDKDVAFICQFRPPYVSS